MMHATFSALPGVFLLEFSRTAFSMECAGIAGFLVALWAVSRELVQEPGLGKIVALANLCFGIPMIVFGAEHFSAARFIMMGVPKFMPWPLFWTYLVGAALVAGGLSIVTKIQAQWSGLLFGIMMFLFVAMMDIPGTLADLHNRFSWALMLREAAFGGGGWMIAASAMNPTSTGRKTLLTVGRIVLGVAAAFYGVEHFLHPLNVPGVPLAKLMPEWIPARVAISYFTGLMLVVWSFHFLLGRKTKLAATYLGAWIFLIVVFIYGPILAVSVVDPSTAVKVEGLNYFFDTMLFAGTILALAKAAPASE